MRTWTLWSALFGLACARGTAGLAATVPDGEGAASDSEAAAPAAAPADPLAVIRGEADPEKFAGLLTWLEGQVAGRERDALLVRAAAILAGWPDALRQAPEIWLYDLIEGREHVGWPLVRAVRGRFLDSAKTVRLVGDPALATITDLGLTNEDDPALVFAALRASPHLGGVERLRLGGPAPALTRLVTGELRTPRLRRLDLYCDDVAALAVGLAASASLASLEGLALSGSPIGRGGLTALVRSPHLRGLKELDLGDLGLGDDDKHALAGGFPELRRLELAGDRLGVAGIRALVDAPWFAALTHLDLARTQIGADGARVLARGLGAELRALVLAGSDIGSDGIVAIAGARQLAGLERLDLSSIRIEPAAALALADATHLRALRSVEFTFRDRHRSDGEVFRALAGAPQLARHKDRAMWAERAALRDLRLTPEAASAVIPADTRLSLRFAARVAPQITVTVFADGRVELQIGAHRGAAARVEQRRIDLRDVRVLLAEARRIGLPRLAGDGQDERGCREGRYFPFGPHMTVGFDGVSQTIDVSHPCFAAARRAGLVDLAERIKVLTDVLPWQFEPLAP